MMNQNVGFYILICFLDSLEKVRSQRVYFDINTAEESFREISKSRKSYENYSLFGPFLERADITFKNEKHIVSTLDEKKVIESSNKTTSSWVSSYLPLPYK